MPRFKHKSTGNVVDVPEEHAEQVLRKNKHYEEVVEKEEPEPISKDVSDDVSTGSKRGTKATSGKRSYQRKQ